MTAAQPPATEYPGIPPIADQIDALRCLPDGWRNGEGVAFNPEYLNRLSDAIRLFYPAHAPTPTVCPTTYGIVSLEWSFPAAGSSASLEIDPATGCGEFVWVATHPPNSGEIIIDDMDQPAGWQHLADCINALHRQEMLR